MEQYYCESSFLNRGELYLKIVAIDEEARRTKFAL